MPMPGMPYPPVSNSGPPGYPPAGGVPYPPYPSAGGQGFPNHGMTPPYPASGYPPVSQGGGIGGYPPYPANSGNLSYPGSQAPGPTPYAGPGGYPPVTQFNNHQPPFSSSNNVGEWLIFTVYFTDASFLIFSFCNYVVLLQFFFSKTLLESQIL